jgi:hypothetical protein
MVGVTSISLVSIEQRTACKIQSDVVWGGNVAEDIIGLAL